MAKLVHRELCKKLKFYQKIRPMALQYNDVKVKRRENSKPDYFLSNFPGDIFCCSHRPFVFIVKIQS